MRCLVSLVLFFAAAPAFGQGVESGVEPDFCSNISELNNVYFGFEQVALSDDAIERLEENVAAVLDPCPEVGVLIDGWGDDIEFDTRALSIQRAAAVAEWYITRGLDSGRLAVRGGGKDAAAFHLEDPGPGDSRARRVDSEPVPITDLPTDAPDWHERAAARYEPSPSVVRIADDEVTRIFLRMDWALADGEGVARRASCPEPPNAVGETGALVLSLASLVIGDYDRDEDSPRTAKGREIALDTACRTAAWPAASLLGATLAEVVPDVYVLDGTLSPAADPYTAGWIVGPNGSTPTDGLFCMRYQGLEAELNAAVQTLAASRRAGDADGERAAFEVVARTSGDLRDLRDAVNAVGGEADGVRLDCSELHLAYEG